MSDKEKTPEPEEGTRKSSRYFLRPLKKARVDTPAPPPIHVETVKEEKVEEEEEIDVFDSDDWFDFSDDEEDSNSDSSVCNSSDSDFDFLPDEDDIKKMPESMEQCHLHSLLLKRNIRELEAKRQDVKKRLDELITQKALGGIPRWQRQLNDLYRCQQGIKPEVSDEKTLSRFYQHMYYEQRYNFVWTLHVEKMRIGSKAYNFYTKAGEYTDGVKFVNVVVQKSKNHKITSSNWDRAILIYQKESPELFGTSRESKLNLCRKVWETFAEFASACHTESLLRCR
jgi:hypothetical protein